MSGIKAMRMRLIVAVAGFVFITAMGTNCPAADDKKPVSPTEIDRLDNSSAPEFSLKDLNGKPVTLSSLKGKVVLLNFWATWCPSCTSEMPSLNRLHNDMKNRGFEAVAISTDRSANEVREYIAKKSFNFQILMDEGRAVTRKYKVFSLPTTFLINKNGIIVQKFFGEYDWADPDIRKKIEKLL